MGIDKELKTSKPWYKTWWGVVIIAIVSLFAFPFVIGGLLLRQTHRNVKGTKPKLLLSALILVPTLLFGSAWVAAFASPNAENSSIADNTAPETSPQSGEKEKAETKGASSKKKKSAKSKTKESEPKADSTSNQGSSSPAKPKSNSTTQPKSEPKPTPKPTPEPEPEPTPKTTTPTTIEGLAFIGIGGGIWHNWDADAEKDGPVISIVYYDTAGEIISSYDTVKVPITADVQIYAGSSPSGEANKLVFSSTFSYDQMIKTSIYPDIRIPKEKLLVDPSTDYKYGEVAVTVHTPKQGDFSDRHDFIVLYE